MPLALISSGVSHDVGDVVDTFYARKLDKPSSKPFHSFCTMLLLTSIDLLRSVACFIRRMLRAIKGFGFETGTVINTYYHFN